MVTNPPFVISPDNAYLLRDSDATGDELSRDVVRSCAATLTEGGFASVMCNWIHAAGDWQAPLREWLSGLGCDALLLHVTSYEPLAYAITWNSTDADSDPEKFSDTVTRWVSHYRSAGVARIATGLVILRRRSSASNWVRALDGCARPRGRSGEHLQLLFEAGDVLATPGAGQLGELLSGAWRLVDGHRLSQGADYVDGAYTGEAMLSRRPDTGIRATFDPLVLELLVGCDGSRSLGEVIERAAIPGGFTRGEFHSLCLKAVKDLIARGYLVAMAADSAG
ncbi:MAG: hypothetical protein H0W96_09715 [Solirubrobacterales bacterium]|nr:hypothetical protein [Solirubrobacterales bacterium]